MSNSGKIIAALALAGIAAAAQSTEAIPQMTVRAASRVLDQATWGPTPLSVTQLQRMGLENWLNWQFSLNTSDLPDQPLLDPATGKTNTNLRPVTAAFFANTVTEPDQLRQRVAFALSQIWVISHTSIGPAYAFPPYWRIFRDHAFGNYADIIKAVTLNPGMGAYLNMANNVKANPTKGTAANENYSRELMQLFTLGLTQLNPDGTPALDSNHNPVPTYDQTVVTNLARAFTGWTYPTAAGATAKNTNPQYFIGQMFAVESLHDTSAKPIFNGITIPPGQTAEQDLTSVIQALMAQPTMAPFISQQLIEHLVTSNPSPAYVQRVSKVFGDNGQRVAGDMKAVITAILTDPEARAGDDPNAAANPNIGHLREPVLFMPNLLRALNATLTDTSAIYNDTALMGQDLFNPPSVFSYFSPSYRTQGGLLGPEFQIYTTQTAAERADVINAALYGKLDKGTTIDLSFYETFNTSLETLLNTISITLLHDSMSTSLYQAAYNAASAQTSKLAQVQAALYVVLTSNEYQVIQ